MRFEVENKIERCFIKKDLLTDLEEELKDLIPKILSISKEKVESSLKISIADKLGTLVINSLSQYKFKNFNSDTKEIEISITEYGNERDEYINLYIRFHFSKTLSSIRILVDSETPRENVNALLGNINEIIKRHKLRNSFLFPHPIVSWTLYILFISSWILFSSKYFLYGLFYTISYIFYIIFRFLVSYNIFDHKDAERNEKWKFYIITGFISFIIFGTILTYYRKSFLGY